MKKFLLLASVLMATNSYAAPEALKDYVEVVHAIGSGKDIRILLEPGHCTNADGSRVKTTLFTMGAFTPNEVVITPNNEVAASLTHLTMNDPRYFGKVVYQYATFIISHDDNNLRVTSQVLDANNHQPLSDQVTFVCSLVQGGGAAVYAK